MALECFSFPRYLCHNSEMASEVRDIQKHALPNGLVVITETMSHVRSVSVGVWVRNGSRREIPEENGLAHFIEHMVFKGTERRSAEAIAREMDSVGGMLDAFTSKEQICFNAKVLDEHLPIAFDVIADLVLRPKFDSEDVKKERKVVLEEIKMDLDNPEYLLHEIFKRGLAYAVFSELTPYSDAGMMTVYAGAATDAIGQVIDLTIQEFRSLKETLVSEEELRRSKNHLKGSLMLSLESTSSRMSNL